MTPTGIAPGDPGLAARLDRAVEGEVRFDAFTRGLYSTDASHYQIEPLGVVFPRSVTDVEAVMEIARVEGVPVLPRGGGTSQCGQAIGRAIVIDASRYLTAVADGTVDGEVEVEPGVVLDQLNARLRPTGLWFPVDPSTGSRATLGGMAGNNSAGARSLKYGMMVDNVSAVEIVLTDGRRFWLGDAGGAPDAFGEELAALRSVYARDAEEIARRTPTTLRNVAGYNLDRLRPSDEQLAQLLVGSEGTLAFFSRLRLKLSPIPKRRVLGVCHFPGLLEALDTVQHIVRLEPSAVELVDRKVLQLAGERRAFKPIIDTFVRGTPGALLLVEFATDTADGLSAKLDALGALLGDLGHPDSVVRVETTAAQAAVWSVRTAGLSIVMSMAGPKKPVSFIEDCAVPVEHLAKYARRVDEIFARHGVEGTWYAHASVGCLHVRPALNLKDPSDVTRIRSIAEATHSVVTELHGTHSGEHGDGLLRSEFLRALLGDRMADAYADVKRVFDPLGLMNPGKIVDPPRMDDRSLFRYRPGYRGRELPVVLDWSATGGLLGAVERCDNNGACRKASPDVMCPSFRVTHDERHSTRGRANALRLALTNQLGPQGLDSPEMADALSLCISCKACKRECPTGVDMARIKLEWQQRQNRHRGVPLRERLLANLPRLAPRVGRLAPLLNVGARMPLGVVGGIARQRTVPRFHRRPWRDSELQVAGEPEAVLFIDTFVRWFEPEIARAAARVLAAGGWSVASARGSGRPLCCGRTFLSAGMLDQARAEARRLVAVLAPLARRGIPIVGLEPSCLYTLRDELPALLPGEGARAVAEQAMLLEELLDRAWSEGREVDFTSAGGSTGRASRQVLVHGHCHQKAFGGMDATMRILGRLPGHDVSLIESTCCGMAGAFGYRAEHYDVSMRIGELALLPAVRAAPDQALIVANGTSCRTQIVDGTGRQAQHAAVVLASSLDATRAGWTRSPNRPVHGQPAP